MNRTQASAVLIADDIELNRAILNEVLCRKYSILEAANGEDAVSQIEQHADKIAIVLLDIIMPVMDGFQVLEEMNRRGLIGHIPVILISSEQTENAILRGLELGASDFIGRPFNPNIVQRRVENITDLYRYKSQLEKNVLTQMQQLQQANHFMVDTLSTVVEFRSGETQNHTRRVCKIAELLLRELAPRRPEYLLTEEKISQISNAAAMHDIGKIKVPEQILTKPGRLTREEFETVENHTVAGGEILENMDHLQDWSYYQYCYDISRFHHERWDGSGYPDGLSGPQIPISAQVVAVADVYDTLTGKRVYKAAFTHEEALRMILDGECGAFNPEILECLVAISPALRDNLEDLDAAPEMMAFSAAADSGDDEPQMSDRVLTLLELEREKYQTLAALSDEILLDYDAASDTVVFSEKYKDVFEGDIVVPDFRRFVSETDLLDDEGRGSLSELLTNRNPAQPVQKLRVRVRTLSGNFEWFEIIIKSLWSNDAEPVHLSSLGKLVNIDAQIQQNDRLRDRADRDPLTGLLNRNAARRRINEILGQSGEVAGALMFIDVDHFKTINDTCGHVFGDTILKYLAGRMNAIFRTTDITARVGGDEFLIYLDGISDRDIIARKAEELRGVFHDGYGDGDSVYPLSCSIGIACFPQDAETYDELFDRADQAMYVSKNTGKDIYSFYRSDMARVQGDNNLSEID